MEKIQSFGVNESARRKRVNVMTVYDAIWTHRLVAEKDANGVWRISADALQAWQPRRHPRAQQQLARSQDSPRGSMAQAVA